MNASDIISTIGLVISAISVLTALIVYLLNLRDNKIRRIEKGIQQINNNLNILKYQINEDLFYSIVYSYFYDSHIQIYLQEIYDNIPDSVEKEDIDEVIKQIISNRLKIIPYECHFDSIENIESIFSDSDSIIFSSLSDYKFFNDLIIILRDEYLRIKQNIVSSMRKEETLKSVIFEIIENDRKTIFTINQFTNRIIDAYINDTTKSFSNFIELKENLISALILIISKFQSIKTRRLLKGAKTERKRTNMSDKSIKVRYKAIEKHYQEFFDDTAFAGQFGEIKTKITEYQNEPNDTTIK